MDTSTRSRFSSIRKFDSDLTSDFDVSFSVEPSNDSNSDSRDEVQEVRQLVQKEENDASHWRYAITLLLVLVASVVSGLTWHFLREEESKAFETAVDQFSKALADSTYQQQEDIREAYNSFADTLSNWVATAENVSWPFVTLPLFESYARHALKISGTEVFAVFPLVSHENREAWVNYTIANYEDMVQQAHMIGKGNLESLVGGGFHPYIARPSPNGFIEDIERDQYFPMWHFSPPPFTHGAINWNVQSVDAFRDVVDALLLLKNETVISPVRPYTTAGMSMSQEEHEAMHSTLKDSSTEHPHSFVYTAVHEDANDRQSPIVAVVSAGSAWDASLYNLLPDGVMGMKAVIQNNCGQQFTYEINGPEAIFLGEGDLHEPEYNEYKLTADLSFHTHPDFETTPGHCQFQMHIYPDSTFADLYFTWLPTIYACAVGASFLFVFWAFYVYNAFVNTRKEKLIGMAARSNAVISSLFPGKIRDQILGEETSNSNPRSFEELLGASATPGINTSAPLADYFATATVMFADICGFTAWSSVREPSQVFTLLEAVYGSFDKICKHTKVFKVETVGDCYVAATGIPKYHRDHAVLMIQFAHQISKEMTKMTQMLETTLGPDTSDLLLRIGIHTGPVTAGVIRGDKARFQLFGDTMNVASRIESNGIAGRIHISHETAECIRKCGKGHWLVKREDGSVVAKGKGDIQTYWIGKAVENSKPDSTTKYDTASESAESETFEEFGVTEQLCSTDGREDRLVNWNVTVFLDILKHIVARRNAYKKGGFTRKFELRGDDPEVLMSLGMRNYKPINGVREIIALPEFNDVAEGLKEDLQHVDIPKDVIEELRNYISTIAGLYRSNPFHNFEHASHVTMSVIKLLSRIKAPSDLEALEGRESSGDMSPDIHAQMHDHTYGITSDPLTQFACAFAALVHDVDHEGVPNTQLVKERAGVALVYDARSVAEQNSLVLAWNLLMSNRFAKLRSCICATATELTRFRELAINGVMATDIVDKELKQLRNNRWDKAFKRDNSSLNEGFDGDYAEQDRESINRKATIVIEHLIQASDVSHTMQHWHVYRKWNENLFRETYKAWQEGRCDSDPSINWYKGEIGFFDFYIIPLAKKLESCGVFGKSSDEFLNYAKSNREEWGKRGELIVQELVANAKNEFGEKRKA
ncbi:unnamed protein product [Cylindrotheca closterium]|uniref:Guanylate cyclase domain-containing protein n=1 Tax=Cylindrotheca closterium TaxID=2856 RepID=A0AAD2FJZ0_9STRA|nr:unnamed protein product [Cylindrotheca closterium]